MNFSYKNNKLWHLIDQLPNVKFTTDWDHLNYRLIPTTVIEAKPGNEVYFNAVQDELQRLSHFKPVRRTPSGGVSIAVDKRFSLDQYDIRQQSNVVEITILTLEKSCRIQWRLKNYKTKDNKTDLVSAASYFNKYWLPACTKFGIDMNSYIVDKETAKLEKQQIHKPDIKLYNWQAVYRPVPNVYHLDFHKFYMSGLIATHPEFKPVVEHLLKDTKNEALHKTGLASLIGYWQSSFCGYKWARLTKEAINNAYSRFDKVKEDLVEAGRKLILTNTDGIWYQGDEYHGEYEGPELTCWNNDHFNCTIWAKSAGAYQYIENNKVHTVVRGPSKRDKIMSRDDWEFGDIFDKTTEAQFWNWNINGGIKWHE